MPKKTTAYINTYYGAAGDGASGKLGGDSIFEHNFIPPLVVEEKSDIRLDCLASANNMSASGGFGLVLAQ